MKYGGTREYIIQYQAGTSPYWYCKSVWAATPADALAAFVCGNDCPYNVRGVTVTAI